MMMHDSGAYTLLSLGTAWRTAGKAGWRSARRTVSKLIRAPQILRFYRSGATSAPVKESIGRSEGRDALLVTVAFNRADLIALQAEAFAKWFTDSYFHLVVDNSSEMAVRDEIRAVCRAAGSGYISLPANPALRGSWSHGLALNWVHRNVTRNSGAKYVGYLDHDIIPFRCVAYRGIIDAQGVYGHPAFQGPYYYYWPGLVFYSVGYFDRGAPDFRPATIGGYGLDTGGGNCARYYSRLATAPSVMHREDVWAEDLGRAFDPANDGGASIQEVGVHIFDRSWVHLVNGSNWKGIAMDEKNARLRTLLQRCRETFVAQREGD